LIGKPQVILRSTSLDDLHKEIRSMLDEFVDIIIDDIPSSFLAIRNINNHIDLMSGWSLQNKATYKKTPKEKVEVKRKVKYCWK